MENGDQHINSKRVLVTGANGFIGRVLCKELGNRGYYTRTLDRFVLERYNVLKEFAERFQPDYIVHLASYGNMSNQIDVNETITTNILKTDNLLQATINVPYKTFINVSTSSVYGKQTSKMSENMRPRPDTFYASTKMSAELLCRAYRKKYKKHIVTIRPFSVYGPGEADFRFIPTLVHNYVTDQISNVIYGNHDWIHVQDFVEGLLHIMECQNLEHRTYNLGTGIETSNERIAQMLGITYIQKDEWKIQDSPRWQADMTRTYTTGWKPKIALQDGLQQTLEFYKKKYEKR